MSKSFQLTYSYNHIIYKPGASFGRKKKSFLYCFIAIALIVFWCLPVNAQITLTSSNVGSFFSVGTTMTGISDTVTKSVNIGTTGATSWNFSTLNASIISKTTCVLANSTPYYSFFPNASVAQQIPITNSYGSTTMYAYYSIGTNLLYEGAYASGAYSTGTFTTKIKNLPEEITYHLPITYGTTWTSNYADSTITTISMPPYSLPPTVSVINYVVQYTADAYGSMTLPGGETYQALRIKVDRRSYQKNSYSRTVSYTYLTTNGTSVTVTAADTMQSNTGTINVSSVDWSNSSLTAVQESNAIPTGFTLFQNYPNPFNPTTKIKFGLPANSFTTLKIYDILGREVKTLVNVEMTTGYHEVELNANDLPSGIYLYKLQTNSFTDVKKLILLK